MKKITKSFIVMLVLAFMAFIPIKPMLFMGDIIQTVVEAETYTSWNSTTIYNNGDIVLYNGSLWMARWWTQGQTPGTTGEWGVWKLYKSDAGTSSDTNGSKKLIALTFDDGPSITTPLVLDKLQKYNIVASFFLIGVNITDETKDYMKRELSLGCEINNHSWSHSYMDKMSGTDVVNEVQSTSNAIYEAVGVYPKFFRPPYIVTSNTMYDSIDIPFICGMGCNDWDSSVSSQARAATVINNAKDGEIILMHDFNGNTQTVDALDIIIPALKEKGFTFVTVSDLFKQKGVNPNVEYKLWTNVTE